MLHKVKLYAFFSLVCDGPPDIMFGQATMRDELLDW